MLIADETAVLVSDKLANKIPFMLVVGIQPGRFLAPAA